MNTTASVVLIAVAVAVTGGWSAVRLASGQKGYMRSEFLAGATGLRAIFNLRQVSGA